MLNVTKVGKHFGALISGVDLSQPIDDDTFSQIAKAFFENEVAFFRDQWSRDRLVGCGST